MILCMTDTTLISVYFRPHYDNSGTYPIKVINFLFVDLNLIEYEYSEHWCFFLYVLYSIENTHISWVWHLRAFIMIVWKQLKSPTKHLIIHHINQIVIFCHLLLHLSHEH